MYPVGDVQRVTNPFFVQYPVDNVYLSFVFPVTHTSSNL